MKDPGDIDGEEMDKLNPEAFVIKAKRTNIFAEIEPRQKERIIKALQKSNLTVGYIGDGINDVAAINAADIYLLIMLQTLPKKLPILFYWKKTFLF